MNKRNRALGGRHHGIFYRLFPFRYWIYVLLCTNDRFSQGYCLFVMLSSSHKVNKLFPFSGNIIKGKVQCVSSECIFLNINAAFAIKPLGVISTYLQLFHIFVILLNIDCIDQPFSTSTLKRHLGSSGVPSNYDTPDYNITHICDVTEIDFLLWATYCVGSMLSHVPPSMETELSPTAPGLRVTVGSR